MPTQLLAEDVETARESQPAEEPMHEWARKHLERVHKLRVNIAVYFVGMFVLTCVWAITQWSDNGSFERLDFSPEGAPGPWEPWIVYPGLIWGLFVAIDALKVHFDQPITEGAIDREVRRREPGTRS